MKEKLLDILSCPLCKNTLELDGEIIENSEVKEGKLQCREYKTIFPIGAFIPRFVETDEYVDTFSVESVEKVLKSS